MLSETSLRCLIFSDVMSQPSLAFRAFNLYSVHAAYHARRNTKSEHRHENISEGECYSEHCGAYPSLGQQLLGADLEPTGTRPHARAFYGMLEQMHQLPYWMEIALYAISFYSKTSTESVTVSLIAWPDAPVDLRA